MFRGLKLVLVLDRHSKTSCACQLILPKFMGISAPGLSYSRSLCLISFPLCFQNILNLGVPTSTAAVHPSNKLQFVHNDFNFSFAIYLFLHFPKVLKHIVSHVPINPLFVYHLSYEQTNFY